MSDQPTIGDHLGRIRRQSTLTQEQLAERAGVSVETIRKLEQNERTSARMSTLGKLARALHVPTTALLGSAARAAADREPTALPLGLVDVRRALTPIRDLAGQPILTGPEPEPPTVAEMHAATRAADRLYHANDYGNALAVLPRLLVDARTLASTSSGDDQAAAYAVSAYAHQLAGRLLIQLRQVDLAHAALTAAMDAAGRSGNRLTAADVVQPLCWLLLRQGRYAEAEQLAIRTADAVEPKLSAADPAELSSWGWLLLTGASAAVRDGRDDDAASMLDLAAAAAHRAGDDPGDPLSMGAGYCASKVQMMKVEAAVIAGEPGRALELSAAVQPQARVTPSCRQRWRLDVAWSYVQTGQHTEATATLAGLARQAPTWLRHQRYGREIVSTLATERRRAMSRELAGLADLVGCTL